MFFSGALAQNGSDTIDTRDIQSGCFSTPEGKAFLEFINLKSLIMCPFAKRANIIDHMSWDTSLPFEVNLEKLFSNICAFADKCEKNRLDGFLLTAPSYFSTSPEMLGEFLRRILFYLSDHDPTGFSSLNQDMSDSKWRYRFSHMYFFVATFSPCYGMDSSRSTMGIDQTIIMFQPKVSFIHAMSSNHIIKTNQHQYVRDKFCRGGVPYNLRELECHRFVLPREYSGEPIEWWKPNNMVDFEEKPKESAGNYLRICSIM